VVFGIVYSSGRLPRVSATAGMRFTAGMGLCSTAAGLAAGPMFCLVVRVWARPSTIDIASVSTSLAAPSTTIGRKSSPAVIPSSTIPDEAMAAPAVAIAPAGPGSHSQEDPVVEVSRPVISHRRAAVGRFAIVAVRTDGLNAYPDNNLCPGRWR
jgi:hypothetical protein